MRKHSNLFVLSLFVFVITMVSCTKSINSTSSSQRLVSYSLTSSNYQPFSNISYTDANGAAALSSAADSTSFWTQTVVTSISPFNAQMEVQGQNNTPGTINYTIFIYVDGVVKATKQDSVVKFSSFDSKISAIVQ